ncbi:MAG: PIN domain-containing protein [Desulfurococcales archaeon]|nr:PIN domain-containing protein [Desulfurococcales archaeon]
MNGLVYLDTSIILSILLETEKYQVAEDVVASFQDKTFVTSGIALNEAFYVAAFEYYRQRGLVKGRYSFREVIGKQGYPREVVELVLGFVSDLRIKVLEDYYDFKEYIQVMTTYRLLPNDAQIALTCRHYSIDTILTFDEDFKRVPWLKVIPNY